MRDTVAYSHNCHGSYGHRQRTIRVQHPMAWTDVWAFKSPSHSATDAQAPNSTHTDPHSTVPPPDNYITKSASPLPHHPNTHSTYYTGSFPKITCHKYSNTLPDVASSSGVSYNHFLNRSYSSLDLFWTCALETANCAQHGAARICGTLSFWNNSVHAAAIAPSCGLNGSRSASGLNGWISDGHPGLFKHRRLVKPFRCTNSSRRARTLSKLS